MRLQCLGRLREPVGQRLGQVDCVELTDRVLGESASAMQACNSSSLSAKTRKIVPSPMPAARAIFAVVTAAPYSAISGIAVWMIIARRCSGDMAGARRRVVWFSLGAVMTTRLRSESSLRQ